MKARRLLAAALLAAVAVVVWAIRRGYSAAPEIHLATARREALVSTLATNGKVEPCEFVEVRAAREGLLERVAVEKGRRVQPGALLAELDDREARAGLGAAQARLQQARAALEILEGGGRAAELAEIENALGRARLELETAERDYQVFERLAGKQAVSARELEAARDRLQRARLEIQGLTKKRAALVSPAERTAAEARLKESEAARRQAEQRLQQCRILSPLGGVVYDLPVRRGDYLRPGDLVASVGKLDPVRVRVYVDEPELGRLAQGMPVTITWDALPGRQWKGRIEQTPLQVAALGTRQVGEVVLTIQNPNQDLLPGSNVDAEIRTQTINDALIIPKEAVRRQEQQTGVYLLGDGDRLSWRAVKLGASSLTRAQVLEGLREGDRVALGSERTLSDGLRVRPLLP